MPGWFSLLLVIAVFWSAPVAAFQDTDLEVLAQRAQTALGPGFRWQVAGQKRVTLTCANCTLPVMVTLQIGSQTDGTEERVRNGKTTIARLEQLCQAKEPTCRIERADIGRTVGWVSTFRAGTAGGSTMVLLRNGNMLTVRSKAATPQAARENIRRLQFNVLPQITGL